jgi:exopolyphosphatase/guanosine-5'-triphosphate,3'-diphosphate pyrophosphatase
VTGEIAAIDCGTNTIKLYIGRPPEVTVRLSRIVRLGQGVDRTGRLADEALARTFAAVEEYAALVAEHGVPPERLRFCATSATRDAENGEEFAQGVEKRLGVRPEVLSGSEEAALCFIGAARALSDDTRGTGGPVLVLDIGGGSTELVLGSPTPEPRIATSFSMDVGSVRLHERHLHDDPPRADQVAACVADIESALEGCPVDPADADRVVGVAGTVVTVGCGVLGLPAYDSRLVDQAALPVTGVHEYVAWLVGLSVAERRALPYMHPGRADVIDAGALILDRVLRRARVPDLTVSEADILDGIAWSVAEGRP